RLRVGEDRTERVLQAQLVIRPSAGQMLGENECCGGPLSWTCHELVLAENGKQRIEAIGRWSHARGRRGSAFGHRYLLLLPLKMSAFWSCRAPFTRSSVVLHSVASAA